MTKDENKMKIIAIMARHFFFNRLDFVKLLSTIDFYDAILVHVLKNVRCVHQDPNGTRGCHNEKNVKLQSIDYHRHVLPIFSRLKHVYILTTNSRAFYVPLFNYIRPQVTTKKL